MSSARNDETKTAADGRPTRGRDTRMWGGRFEEPTDALVERVNASIGVDQAMAEDDLRGSMDEPGR